MSREKLALLIQTDGRGTFVEQQFATTAEAIIYVDRYATDSMWAIKTGSVYHDWSGARKAQCYIREQPICGFGLTITESEKD